MDSCEFMSRRDFRTEPGVLTPGADKKTGRPKGAVELVRRKVRPSRTSRRSQRSAAPCEGGPFWTCFPGLKPRAESCSPFGTKTSLTAVHVFETTSVAGFEDEDDDEDKYEAPYEGRRLRLHPTKYLLVSKG